MEVITGRPSRGGEGRPVFQNAEETQTPLLLLLLLFLLLLLLLLVWWLLPVLLLPPGADQ